MAWRAGHAAHAAGREPRAGLAGLRRAASGGASGGPLARRRALSVPIAAGGAVKILVVAAAAALELIGEGLLLLLRVRSAVSAPLRRCNRDAGSGDGRSHVSASTTVMLAPAMAAVQATVLGTVTASCSRACDTNRFNKI